MPELPGCAYGDPDISDVSAEHIIADLHAVLAKLEALELEFGPLARKYRRLVGGVDFGAGLPGAGWRRPRGT